METTTRRSGNTSYGEFRSKWRSYGNHFATADRNLLFWRYLTEKAPLVEAEFDVVPRPLTMSHQQQRTISKPTDAAAPRKEHRRSREASVSEPQGSRPSRHLETQPHGKS